MGKKDEVNSAIHNAQRTIELDGEMQFSYRGLIELCETTVFLARWVKRLLKENKRLSEIKNAR